MTNNTVFSEVRPGILFKDMAEEQVHEAGLTMLAREKFIIESFNVIVPLPNLITVVMIE